MHIQFMKCICMEEPLDMFMVWIVNFVYICIDHYFNTAPIIALSQCCTLHYISNTNIYYTVYCIEVRKFGQLVYKSVS